MSLLPEFLGEMFSFLKFNTDGSFVIWLVTIIFVINIYLLIRDKGEMIDTLIKISLSLSILGMLWGFTLTTYSAGAPVVPMSEKAHTMLWGYSKSVLSLAFHFSYKIILDILSLSIKPNKG